MCGKVECDGEVAKPKFAAKFKFNQDDQHLVSEAGQEVDDCLNNAIDEDSGSLRRKAKELAKARFHSSWKIMKKKEKNKWIEACEHELKLTVMGAHSFLLTSFQMSVRANVSKWYPQWHLVRRTFLNILYFEGMRTGTGQVGFWDYQADWRVVVVVLLAVSNLIQAYCEVFRDPEVRRLTSPM